MILYDTNDITGSYKISYDIIGSCRISYDSI